MLHESASNRGFNVGHTHDHADRRRRTGRMLHQVLLWLRPSCQGEVNPMLMCRGHTVSGPTEKRQWKASWTH
ncbi:unnamed protein product [Protopolystoma xenopodis]|uniref:Uncharacterized protein n=1 Tax=Protopolystoma xenopodis TaxID=117903 RepID=A0A3S5C573_9PLAT|nr:unnamed protein product [Protopolystoma xenopodis]